MKTITAAMALLLGFACLTGCGGQSSADSGSAADESSGAVLEINNSDGKDDQIVMENGKTVTITDDGSFIKETDNGYEWSYLAGTCRMTFPTEWKDRFVVRESSVYSKEIFDHAENTGKLAERITQSPGNALAVALSANRNKVYREVILQSVEIVNDIRIVCLSDVKMTEKERTEIVFGVRPKLKGMNKKLERLIRAVKYTTLTDVWNEVSGNQPDKADIEGISTEAFRRWKTIGKTVRP